LASLPNVLSRKFWVPAFAAAASLVLLLFVTVGSVGAQQMVATWYGPGFEGATTASGEPFDPNAYTAAHKTLPFGTKLLVTYGGSSVVVEVNDRGPFVEGIDLDLSRAAADAIGLTAVGTATVNVETVGSGTPTGPQSGGTAGSNQQPQEPVSETSNEPAQSEAPQQNVGASVSAAGAVQYEQYEEEAAVEAAADAGAAQYEQYEEPAGDPEDVQTLAAEVEEFVAAQQYDDPVGEPKEAAGQYEVVEEQQPADEAPATTVNAQQCISLFGAQAGAQYQAYSEGSVQDLTQQQVQYCLQVIQNVTVEVPEVEVPEPVEEAVVALEREEPASAPEPVPVALVGEVHLPIDTGVAVLPNTGGPLAALPLAGGALIGAGLLLRRLIG
jgi:rare lipoprotein A